MARALLTADELRRMDVDECIIYEKGIKAYKKHKNIIIINIQQKND